MYGTWWNQEKLMDLHLNECGVKYKAPPVIICCACKYLKNDFHMRLGMLRKFKTDKRERKWKNKSEMNNDYTDRKEK